jgi:hypothetical protein
MILRGGRRTAISGITQIACLFSKLGGSRPVLSLHFGDDKEKKTMTIEKSALNTRSFIVDCGEMAA